MDWQVDVGMGDPHAIFAFRTQAKRRCDVHTHSFHEFVYFEAGAGWQLHGNQRFPARDGDLFFLPVGDWHIAATDTQATLIVLNFYTQSFAASIPSDAESLAMLRTLRERAHGGQPQVPLTGAAKPEVRRLMEAMVSESADPRPGGLTAMKIHLQSLLLVLLRETPACQGYRGLNETPLSDHHAEQIEQVLVHIREHLAEPLHVVPLARLAGMNRSSFHETFRRHTGHTLVTYINRLRVQQACVLLEKADLPLPIIAERCGFPCRSHFHAVFRDFTGQAPREYRISHRAAG
jgi:AraC-like DNA-binding protein